MMAETFNGSVHASLQVNMLNSLGESRLLQWKTTMLRDYAVVVATILVKVDQWLGIGSSVGRLTIRFVGDPLVHSTMWNESEDW